jgi:hypothetical protein
LFDFIVEVMEFRQQQEMKRMLQAHEDIIQDNKATICIILVKIKDNGDFGTIKKTSS